MLNAASDAVAGARVTREATKNPAQNSASALLPALWFRQCVTDFGREAESLHVEGRHSATTYARNVMNPLLMVMYTIFDGDNNGLEAEDAARICGIMPDPIFGNYDNAFSEQVPEVTIEVAERALGRLALMKLATDRNDIRREMGIEEFEDILQAPAAFKLLLESMQERTALEELEEL